MLRRLCLCFRFATLDRNALLFYNGRFNEKHDFVALEIVDQQLQFSFSLGSDVTRVSPYVEGGVSNGRWQHVTVEYLNRVRLNTTSVFLYRATLRMSACNFAATA